MDKRIVCIGDSFTRGLMVPKGRCWCDRLKADLKGADIEVLNRGINGDTTSGMLSRLGHDVIDLMPRLVLITGGLNDLIICGRGGVDIAKNNYMAMTHIAASHGIIPVVCTEPLPEISMIRPDWQKLSAMDEMEANVNDFTTWLHTFAKAFGFYMIDFRAAFNEWAPGKSKESVYVDGMHLSEEGHVVMYAEAKKALKEIVSGLGWDV